MTDIETLHEMIGKMESNRIVWTPEQIAAAAAAEQRMREYPISDEDAVKAAVSFIAFTPLGGE